MSNRFITFLEAVGRDFRKGLDYILPIAATAGEVGIAIFAPGLGTIFNTTVNAVITAEQAAVAAGKQAGTGPQKAANVLALVGPLIKVALDDAGKASDDVAVQKYIDSIVTILNAIPSVPAKT